MSQYSVISPVKSGSYDHDSRHDRIRGGETFALDERLVSCC